MAFGMEKFSKEFGWLLFASMFPSFDCCSVCTFRLCSVVLFYVMLCLHIYTITCCASYLGRDLISCLKLYTRHILCQFDLFLCLTLHMWCLWYFNLFFIFTTPFQLSTFWINSFSLDFVDFIYELRIMIMCFMCTRIPVGLLMLLSYLLTQQYEMVRIWVVQSWRTN